MKILTLFLLFLTIQLFPQNEANVWYFQHYCGLDFNSGIPVVLYDGQVAGGYANATICDSLGNFLFSTDWFGVYNDHGSMQNSGGLECPGLSGTAIVKWPGINGVYYIFTGSYDGGLYYLD